MCSFLHAGQALSYTGSLDKPFPLLGSPSDLLCFLNSWNFNPHHRFSPAVCEESNEPHGSTGAYICDQITSHLPLWSTDSHGGKTPTSFLFLTSKSRADRRAGTLWAPRVKCICDLFFCSQQPNEEVIF